MNTSTAGGSIAQDVQVATNPGDSYAFSIWLRSPTGHPISGSVCLWGLGGTNENGETNFTVDPQWTLVTAPLDVAVAGHTTLRAEIYIGATGQNLDADGAQLTKNLLTNASFEHSGGGWNRIANASSVNYTTYNNAARAHDGTGFMEMNTSVPGGSVAQDVVTPLSPGDSYTYSVWLRSPTGHPISGSVCLWGMGGTQESGSTNFTVGSAWTLVSAPLDVANAGHTQLRAEVYETTTGQNLDLDGATFARGNAADTPPAITLLTATSLTGPKSVKVKRTLKLTGRVSLTAAPGLITITKTRLVGKKWKSAGSAKVSVASGTFSYSFKPTVRGSWRFVATYSGSVTGSTTYKSSKSAVKTMNVE